MPGVLRDGQASGAPVSLRDHYERVEWVDADIQAPELPDEVVCPVVNLLTDLSLRRHGQAALLRALTRAERAPASISAF
ncbi:hypothetical protein [Amycolatopsis pigmentata]|uniref:Uncharacterized protein n=1 Tax=Amycolatopsis pigmentata TaxID=450801 RepID=A0ABW5G497_9PSEU